MTNAVSPDAHDADRRAAPEGIAFWVLLCGVALALGWILWPFYGTILWSAIIAMVFAPVNSPRALTASRSAQAPARRC